MIHDNETQGVSYASHWEVMMAEPTCLTCRFFVFEGDPEDDPVKGKCRRYPPSQYTPQWSCFAKVESTY